MSEATSLKPGDIQVFDVETLIEPYDAYSVLRDQAPVFHVPEMNMHYVTRYELVREALKDTATYSSQFDQFMNTARLAGLAGISEETRERLIALDKEMIQMPPTMLTLDEPDHTKYRSLVSQLFTGSQVKKAEDQARRGGGDSGSDAGRCGCGKSRRGLHGGVCLPGAIADHCRPAGDSRG